MNVFQQGFGENPELGHRDISKSLHELLMEPRAKVEPCSGKHCMCTLFPKDPNCDICLKTKRKRASGDLITADHKVLRKESEFQK